MEHNRALLFSGSLIPTHVNFFICNELHNYLKPVSSPGKHDYKPMADQYVRKIKQKLVIFLVLAIDLKHQIHTGGEILDFHILFRPLKSQDTTQTKHAKSQEWSFLYLGRVCFTLNSLFYFLCRVGNYFLYFERLQSVGGGRLCDRHSFTL